MIERLFSRKSIKTAFIMVMALLALISLLQGVKNAYEVSQDFQWDAMKVFSLKINPYDESASMNPSGILDKYGYDEYYLQMEANQFPSLLMLLLPFVSMEPLTARYAWIVCNLIFTGLIILLLRKTFLSDMDKYGFFILSLLMIAGTPYRNQLGVGQHTLFAFCFFLIAVYFSEFSEKRNAVIVTLALFVCYFKYTLTVPLALYLIYKKRYKEIVISAMMHVLLTFVAAWWLNDSFINMIIKPLKVASAISADGGIDLSAIFSGSIVAYILALVVMIMLFILALKLPSGYDRLYMALLVLWSLIVTYHRTYDFFVMIVVFGMFLELKGKGKEAIIDSQKLEYLKTYYIVTMCFVFFVLRIFSENMPSKLVVGLMYYVLTVLVSILSYRLAFKNKESNI